MRNRTVWVAPSLLAALVLAVPALGGPPGAKGFARGPGDKAGCDKAQVGLGKAGFVVGAGQCDKAQVGLGKGGFVGGFGKKAAAKDDKGREVADKDGAGKKAGAGKDGDRGGARGPGDRGGRGGFQPGRGPGGRRGPGDRGGRGVTAEQVIERIMALDKNKDGKISKDELPERMQDQVAKGDTNKDGSLDKEEIKKLSETLARDGFGGLFGDRGGFGGRFGRGGPPGPFGGFGDRPPPGPIEQRALGALKLSDATKEKAEALVKAHQENVRKLAELARADLLLKMKDVLSEAEYKSFKEALDRPAPPR